jgi:hypothetical protein
MTSLRGPDGSPSDPDDLVGSSGSAPASPDSPLEKRAPWPAPGAARGPLAWSDDELAGVNRDNHITFPPPTAESESQPEARLEALNEAIESGAIVAVIEAIESGALERKRPGRKLGKALARASDDKIAHDCLTEARGNVKAAKRAFVELVKKGMRKKALENGSADTTAVRRWYLATEAYGGSRRARQK